MIAGRAFKAKCQRCGAEHLVSPSKPGLHLFVCQQCGAQHAMIFDSNLDLRDFRLVEQVDAMPAGFYEVSDVEMLPAMLKEVFAKLGSASDERVREAIELAKRLGLFRVRG